MKNFLKRNKHIFFLFFFLIFLLVFDLFFAKYKYTHTFFIKRNQTLNQITTNLYKEKIIDASTMFSKIKPRHINEILHPTINYKKFQTSTICL